MNWYQYAFRFVDQDLEWQVHNLKKFAMQKYTDSRKFLFRIIPLSSIPLWLLRSFIQFFIGAGVGSFLPCRSTHNDPMIVRVSYVTTQYPHLFYIVFVSGQKLSSSCSQTMPRLLSIYTGKQLLMLIVIQTFLYVLLSGNEREILLFLMFESVVLIIVAALVRFCCIFWKKKKLQGQDLGKFLEKRVSSIFFCLLRQQQSNK